MPVFVDLDMVVLHHLPCSTHSLVVRVLQDFLTVIGMHGVQDVEEVLPVRMLALRKSIRHEDHKLRVIAYFGPQVDHRKLIVALNVNTLHFVHFKEFFLASKNQLQPVFGYHGIRRHIKLDCTKK